MIATVIGEVIIDGVFVGFASKITEDEDKIVITILKSGMKEGK